MTAERDLVTHTCTNCGASLELPPVTPGSPARAACHYCGQTFEAPAPPPPAERVVIVGPSLADAARVAAVTAATRTAASLVRTVVSLIFVFMVLGVVGGIGVCAKQARTVKALSTASGLKVALSAISAPYFWDTVGGPPIPAAVGGHGEGFVGRVRSRADDQLWLAAFEGSKLAQVWKVGPFGTYSQGYQSTFTAVVGGHVVTTDYKTNVHVYDLATGREVHALKTSDRAKSMCVAPDANPHVWIEVADKRDVLVDPDAGTATPSSRPAWCPDLGASSDDCRGWLKRGFPRSGCRDAAFSPKVTGFQAVNVVEQGDLAVAFGKKHPGTATPMAVGFDPHSKAVRWERPIVSGDQSNGADLSTIAEMDALEGGRFVAPYELTPKGWHFTAFDARSGQRLWDTELQPVVGVDHPEGFSLSADRVYVMRTSSVEVYDAKTGALVGVVGQD
jgi:outer membrane protein assembly factor BamB